VERLTEALTWKAHFLALVGRHREAEVIVRGLLSRATANGDRRAMARALGSLSVGAGELSEALRYCVEALDVARSAGLREDEMLALSNGIEFAVECGDWETADRFLHDMEAMPGLPKDVQDTMALGQILLAAYRGEVDEAGRVDEGIGAVQGYLLPPLRAWIQRVRAVERAMAGDLQGAYARAMDAIDEDPAGMNSSAAVWSGGHAAIWMRDAQRLRALFASTPLVEDRAWIRSTRKAHEAALAALDGHVREAAAAYESVLAERLARGDRFVHAQMVLDAVAVLPPDLVPEGAVETARTYLEELGAAGLLARLDGVLTGPTSVR